MLLLLLTGCNKTISLNINPTSITSIIYADNNILNNDYKLVSDEINNKRLFELYDQSIIGDKLTIKTNNIDYNFEIVDKYIIYTVDNHRYFTSTNNLNIILKNMVENSK